MTFHYEKINYDYRVALAIRLIMIGPIYFLLHIISILKSDFPTHKLWEWLISNHKFTITITTSYSHHIIMVNLINKMNGRYIFQVYIQYNHI